jgi:quinol monooxygenase YgiN
MVEVRVIAGSVARTGKEDQLRVLLQGMLIPPRAESGCKLYELYESDSRGRFYFFEEWESQAALDQHVATPHFKHLDKASESW